MLNTWMRLPYVDVVLACQVKGITHATSQSCLLQAGKEAELHKLYTTWNIASD
jgi:hypothetical protein